MKQLNELNIDDKFSQLGEWGDEDYKFYLQSYLSLKKHGTKFYEDIGDYTIVGYEKGRDVHVFVIRGKEIVGVTFGQKRDWRDDRLDGFPQVHTTAVVTEHQGHGLGMKMHKAILEHCKGIISDLTLTTCSWNLMKKLAKDHYAYHLGEGDSLSNLEYDSDVLMSSNDLMVISLNDLEVVSEAADLHEFKPGLGWFKESIVDLPEEIIDEWISNHMQEILEKLKETYVEGYNTYIEDPIVFNNPYTDEKLKIDVNIQKNLMKTSDAIETALYYVEKENAIYISALALFKNLKSSKAIKEYIEQGIWHELTHVVDPDRLSHSQDFSDRQAYINSPREFPAFLRMYIQKIKKSGKMGDFVDALEKDSKLPIKEIDKWFRMLNGVNKEKFKSIIQQQIASEIPDIPKEI